MLETDQESIRIQFKRAGYIKQGKQVVIPGQRLASVPILQPADRQEISEIAIKNKFDFILVPNVTSVKDVQEIKYAKGDEGANLGILAKIDNLEAVH